MPMFEWEAPPPRPRGKYKRVNETAVRLANSKGKWAKIGVYDAYHTAHTRAHRIRTGMLKGFKVVGDFDADVRPTAEGYAVYVRCTRWSKAFANGLDENNPKYWTTEEDNDDADQ